VRRLLLSLLALLLVAVAASAAAPAAAAGGVFSDVHADTPFAADIEWLAAQEIAQGGADGRFRPNAPVTRQAMAVFLYKFANPGQIAPGCDDAVFEVLATSPYCGSIQWLVDERITSGTASGGFAPLDPVTRQSMAAFLYKVDSGGTAPPPCTVSPYADVTASSPFCGSIDWLWTEGITTGALHGNFAPSGTVTRGMMAAFLHRFDVARTTPLGVDVGWPQCDQIASLPTDHAFGIVGVNAGMPRTWNACLAAQLTWAAGASGATAQPKAQMYVNTANPGLASAVYNCPKVSASCAGAYGAARAQEDLDHLTAAGLDPADYVWWLDVEDGNSWETGTDGQARNRAVLEGMVTKLSGKVGGIGLYSASTQWKAIVGTVPTGSNLRGLPGWLTAAIGLGPARRMCAEPALTPGGSVEMVQIVVDGELDRNLVCP
jgi:hypothetical protein